MPAIPDDVFFAPLTEINQHLRNRDFTAVELTSAFSERLEKSGPVYNALALSLRKQGIQKAEEVDKELKRGRLRSPLQGIPYGAKDLLSFAGKTTTWGAKPYAAQVFDYNARVIDKLSGAGAVLIGKLSMVELAGGGGYRLASASLQGPGLNPWNTERWSGGSSSGSGSAVAAGLVPFALGSETSGSIVTPCAFCGVTGLRPTYGLVSRYGAMALSWTMDKIGPIGRTAEDCGYVLQAISGGDDEDPGSARKSFHFAPQYARGMEQLTFGYAPSDFEEAADSVIRPALKAALSALRELRGAWKEAELPDFPFSAMTGTVISAEGSTVFAPLIESGKVEELADPRQIEGLRAGLDIAARDYLQAMRARRLAQDSIGAMFRDFDVLVAPARMGIAPKISEPLDRSSGTSPARNGRGLRAIIPAGNLAGLPALILPCGLADGLPVGISLIGRPFSENTLLKVGMEFQKRTDWHKARPPARG